MDEPNMEEPDLDEVAANVGILIREELDVNHLLGGHPTPVDDCRRCTRARARRDRR